MEGLNLLQFMKLDLRSNFVIGCSWLMAPQGSTRFPAMDKHSYLLLYLIGLVCKLID